MVAPTYGQHAIKEYFKKISKVSNAWPALSVSNSLSLAVKIWMEPIEKFSSPAESTSDGPLNRIQRESLAR